MGCCSAFWCKPQEDDYFVGKDGRRYCIFHVPKGDEDHFSSPSFVKNFNEKIYQLINAAIAEGKECDLSRTIFPGPISFGKYNKGRPLPPISYEGAIFNGDVDFSGAALNGIATFRGATFKGNSDFRRTIFQSKTNFSEVSFCKKVTFAGAAFYAHVSFEDSEFKDEALFGEWLWEKTFCASALFRRIRTKEGLIYFRRIKFKEGCVSFRGTSLTNFRFEGCAWPQKKPSLFQRVMPRCFLNPADTEVFYDEIDADREYNFTPLRRKIVDKYGVLAEKYGVVENLYRQMKQQAKENHNEPEVSRWHYREKEMFRKRNFWRRHCGASAFYWAFSGYGERPVRAGWMLLMLVVTIGLAMNSLGLWCPATEGKVIQCFPLSPNLQRVETITQAVIEHALFVKDPILKAQPGWGGILLTVWTKVLIPVQAALFAFALRNKFRR
jgi:uncharacterized protein YjbI with pentapeptide repeats